MKKYSCSICGSEQENIFNIENVPVVQHRVFSDRDTAREMIRDDITLYRCPKCGFINNTNYKYYDTCYDERYQCDSSYSPFYDADTQVSVSAIREAVDISASIVEVGCGKGRFLEYLRAEGYDAIGFDPAYEGDADYIHKSYFDRSSLDTPVDLVIFRHVLEHIPEPMKVLQELKKAGHKMIYIEVPCTGWLLQHNAFWDVCYEHCNYFQADKLQAWFRQSKVGWLFAGQAFYLIAQLQDLKECVDPVAAGESLDFKGFEQTRACVKDYFHNHRFIIWAAAAKAVMLANQFDNDNKSIAAMIDINPYKQNKFSAGTGHQILPPEEAFRKFPDIDTVLVMNTAYWDEIAEACPGDKNLVSLEDISS